MVVIRTLLSHIIATKKECELHSYTPTLLYNVKTNIQVTGVFRRDIYRPKPPERIPCATLVSVYFTYVFTSIFPTLVAQITCDNY